MRGRLWLVFGLSVALQAEDYRWNLPRGFPTPRVPVSNSMSDAKVRLGRYLFYDRRLSVNGTQSCATCHRQELAFTDGRATAVGATGQSHARSAMSLVNVAYQAQLTWSNPGLRSLEEQATIPLLSEHPVELGMKGRVAAFLQEARASTIYRDLFPKAFPAETNSFTLANIAKALAAFERTIISAGSPYDRFHGGDETAISDAAKRGETLFFSDPIAGCFRCHGGPNFSDGSAHNTGLYNLPGAFSYPPSNLGIFEKTRRRADVGKFKTPTLRNISLTAPYMHDGSIATLEEVLDHYAAGGRTIDSGPYAGRGHANPLKDARITRFSLTMQNRADLLEFLRSLTDEDVTRDPRCSNPW